mmetsp:Transcript_80479/g.231008  ORF Transcript_80479/g.231008 Transcript_80479/m.231008 type:complete len:204 (+) Transcript_80479:1133-1744(+)
MQSCGYGTGHTWPRGRGSPRRHHRSTSGSGGGPDATTAAAHRRWGSRGSRGGGRGRRRHLGSSDTGRRSARRGHAGEENVTGLADATDPPLLAGGFPPYLQSPARGANAMYQDDASGAGSQLDNRRAAQVFANSHHGPADRQHQAAQRERRIGGRSLPLIAGPRHGCHSRMSRSRLLCSRCRCRCCRAGLCGRRGNGRGCLCC